MSVADLPSWLTWQQRPFPDANLLLVDGREPAMVDSGFVGHAPETVEWVHARTQNLQLVVNTHWHCDHVGGNALLQELGAGIAASAPDADAVERRDPGCCMSEYLDQPVPQYSVDVALEDRQVLRLGDTDWEVVGTPGHTAGHLALWQPDERLLVVGDALSDYDVGWVNIAVDGVEATITAMNSLQRLADLRPRIVLPSHGPIPVDTDAAFANATRRAQRLVDDPQGAIWYGARRVFAYALMIRGGLRYDAVEPYLITRPWVADAARFLNRNTQAFATELVTDMIRTGAITEHNSTLHATAPHTPVTPDSINVPPPREWTPTEH
ncbi:MBL fold metallo-hydrolase [Kribbella sp. NPDC055071]